MSDLIFYVTIYIIIGSLTLGMYVHVNGKDSTETALAIIVSIIWPILYLMVIGYGIAKTIDKQ